MLTKCRKSSLRHRLMSLVLNVSLLIVFLFHNSYRDRCMFIDFMMTLYDSLPADYLLLMMLILWLMSIISMMMMLMVTSYHLHHFTLGTLTYICIHVIGILNCAKYFHSRCVLLLCLDLLLFTSVSRVRCHVCGDKLWLISTTSIVSLENMLLTRWRWCSITWMLMLFAYIHGAKYR